MKYRTIDTKAGIIAIGDFEENENIKSYRDFFDFIMEAPSSTVAIPKVNIAETFFDLKSGFAGEVLQKVSTYRKRLVILGDFSAIESKSLRDFIYESNKTGKCIFTRDLEESIELLR